MLGIPRGPVLVPLTVLAHLSFVADSGAQAIGTFRWQLLPYCNVVTVNVAAQPGNIFTIDGFDDQCGAATGATGRYLAERWLHPALTKWPLARPGVASRIR